MSSLVRTKCPHCNAPLKVDPGVDQVTCEFCQHSSLIAKKGQEPRRTQATMHFKTIDVDAAKARARKIVLIVVLGTTLLPIIGIATCLIAVVGVGNKVVNSTFKINGKTVRLNNRAQAQVQQALAQAQAAQAQAQAQAGQAGADVQANQGLAKLQRLLGKTRGLIPGTGTRVSAPDLTKVDGLDLLKQARSAAQQMNPHAVLSSMHFPRVVGGTIDVAGGALAYFTFGYKYRDKTKPPGEDTVKGSISVSLRKGAFTVISSHGSERRLAEPACNTKDMWASAVKSGVPNNAVATVHYYQRGWRNKAGIWSVRVDGHSEYRRDIDGKTCALRRKYR